MSYGQGSRNYVYGQNYPNGYGGYGGNSYSSGQTEWCPSGEGYPAYCPGSGQDYRYTHCCKPFLGIGSGDCCYFAISIWNIIFIIICILAFLALLVVGIRWCWPQMFPQHRNRRQMDPRHHPQPQYSHKYPQNPPGVVQYEHEPFRHY
uniref:Uncharacterized protein n=1 Tax=Panagrolaimus sp. JU765 TaxID=591449 RepID=A0AC34QVE1_9BILA